MPFPRVFENIDPFCDKLVKSNCKWRRPQVADRRRRRQQIGQGDNNKRRNWEEDNPMKSSSSSYIKMPCLDFMVGRPESNCCRGFVPVVPPPVATDSPSIGWLEEERRFSVGPVLSQLSFGHRQPTTWWVVGSFQNFCTLSPIVLRFCRLTDRTADKIALAWLTRFEIRSGGGL